MFSYDDKDGTSRVPGISQLEFNLTQCMFSYHPLTTALSTVTSPVFCELVIGLGEDCVSRQPWRNWFLCKDTDRVLEEQFAAHEDFKLIIRTGGVPDSVTFERDMREAFQLSASRLEVVGVSASKSHVVETYRC